MMAPDEASVRVWGPPEERLRGFERLCIERNLGQRVLFHPDVVSEDIGGVPVFTCTFCKQWVIGTETEGIS